MSSSLSAGGGCLVVCLGCLCWRFLRLQQSSEQQSRLIAQYQAEARLASSDETGGLMDEDDNGGGGDAGGIVLTGVVQRVEKVQRTANNV